MEILEVEFVVFVKYFLDKLRVIYIYRVSIFRVFCVVCFGDEIWICGDDKIISRFNLRVRERIMIIIIKCKICFCDIIVIRKGYFVFIDVDKRTVNIVKKKNKIEKLVKFKKWLFRYVCFIFVDDFLVVMDYVEYNIEFIKVVRYCGFIEK